MENGTKFFCQETQKHQISVSEKIGYLVKNLTQRAATHDNSKFSEEEADLFIKMTPLLKQSTYGSEEYKQFFEITKDVDRILQNLMLASGQKIEPDKTLIIFFIIMSFSCI